MKSLIELTQEFQTIEKLVIESGGELTPELESWLELNQTNLANKVDNYKLIMDYFDARCVYFKQQETMFRDARKTFENQIDNMRSRLKDTMKLMNTTDLHGNDFRYKLSKPQFKMVIYDDKLIPTKYYREVLTLQLDKDLILKDLEQNIEVPGCKFEEYSTLRNYLNNKKAIEK